MLVKNQEVIIKCPDCGHTKFEMPDNAQDDDLITCNNCGLQKTKSEWGDLGIEQATKVASDQAVEEARKILGDSFK